MTSQRLSANVKSLTLVLPCYNESKSLENLFDRILSCAKSRNLSPQQFQIVFVNNGSSDDSSQIMANLLEQVGGEYLSIVNVRSNQGYGHGIYQGLRTVDQGIVAWSHADEQCDPENVFTAWEKICCADQKVLVKGRRQNRSFGDWLFSRCFEMAAFFIIGKGMHEINAQPKVFDAALIEHLTSPPKGFAFDLYVLLKAREAGFCVVEIPVLFPPRKHGYSHWSSTIRSKIKTISGFLSFMIRYRMHRV